MSLTRKVAQAIGDELRRQDYGELPVPLNEDMKIQYLDQGEVDLGQLAKVVINLVRNEIVYRIMQETSS